MFVTFRLNISSVFSNKIPNKKLTLFLAFIQFEEFEASLQSIDPSESNGVRLLTKVLAAVKNGGNLPEYTSFEAFNIDINWILDQYTAIFAGLSLNTVSSLFCQRDVDTFFISSSQKCHFR